MNISLLLIFKLIILQSSPIVLWQTPTTHDFGTLQQHQAAAYTFQFKNNSTDTIIIDNVRTTCGCTVSDWTVEPILPDSLSQIRVVYDADKLGYFRKKIKVFVSHQRKGETLTISGNVE